MRLTSNLYVVAFIASLMESNGFCLVNLSSRVYVKTSADRHCTVTLSPSIRPTSKLNAIPSVYTVPTGVVTGSIESSAQADVVQVTVESSLTSVEAVNQMSNGIQQMDLVYVVGLATVTAAALMISSLTNRAPNKPETEALSETIASKTVSIEPIMSTTKPTIPENADPDLLAYLAMLDSIVPPNDARGKFFADYYIDENDLAKFKESSQTNKVNDLTLVTA